MAPSEECRQVYRRHGESGATEMVAASLPLTSAQGMEARQGGDSPAGSVHNSPVPARGCARI
ncbi:hypothetical protein K7B24_004490 [Salmonella enterica]|nr:hypothetical protein [Salmonella enterica]EGZ8130818.1 hypothetical protein [Salmonella enterica]EHZ8955742.1 hypothetical protein [Salmonella enterica]EIA2373089.1 hypothetical protein [Salmonella enterica]EIK4084507.1 hypothetical protein [Salmonella enterica]